MDNEAGDEHVRFSLYKSALGNQEVLALLLGCLVLDSDVPLVTSILFHLVDELDGEQLALLERVAPEVTRDSVRVRVNERILVGRLAGVGATDGDIEELLSASDWAQRLVVRQGVNAKALSALSESGRTRRVRRGAENALGSPGEGAELRP